MRLKPGAFVATVCVAHVLTMLGFSAFPALLPQFTTLWSLTSTEGGMVNSAFFLGYTVVVPFLVSLTDRVDSRRIYLASALLGGAANLGFAFFAHDALSAAVYTALYGVSLAGTYMPGLRLMSDHLAPEKVARATGYYTASFGLGAAISYVFSDAIASLSGWPWVFIGAAVSGVIALLLILAVAPPAPPTGPHRGWVSLIDPRPVFRNRSVMAYSICYGLHCVELFTVRSWVVAFLAATAARGPAEPLWLAPAMVAALLTLVGVPASIGGNEVAIRTGRRRAIAWAMAVSGLLAVAVAFASAFAYWVAALLAIVHGCAIMADSAALTAGAFGAARPAERGITMAVHSTLGFGGAMIGPLAFGAVLDVVGRDGATGWATAYGSLALVVFLGPLVLWRLKPAAVSGDRPE